MPSNRMFSKKARPLCGARPDSLFLGVVGFLVLFAGKPEAEGPHRTQKRGEFFQIALGGRRRQGPL